MRRLDAFKLGALVSALVLMLSGMSLAAKRKVTYMYNWYGSDAFEEVFLTYIKQFEQEHPDIEVEAVRGGAADREAKLVAAIAGNAAPDVVNFERSIIIEWAAKGLLQPIDRIMAEPLSGKYLPGALAEVMYNGRAYGVPFGTDIRGLFWNRDHFANGGLDPNRGPASIEELDAMAARLSRTGANNRFEQVGFIPWWGNWYAVGWLYTFGKQIFNPETNKPLVNGPNHVRGFEWIQQYAQRYPAGALAGLFSRDPFIEEKVSMIAHESGMVKRIQDTAPDLNYTLGEVPHPAYGSNGTWMGGYAHVIPAGAKNLEEARILLNWLSSRENEMTWYLRTGSLPTRLDAVQASLPRMRRNEQILIQQAGVAHGRPPLWYPPMYTRTTEAMNKVINMQATPRDALDEAQRLLEIQFNDVLGKK